LELVDCEFIISVFIGLLMLASTISICGVKSNKLSSLYMMRLSVLNMYEPSEGVGICPVICKRRYASLFIWHRRVTREEKEENDSMLATYKGNAWL